MNLDFLATSESPTLIFRLLLAIFVGGIIGWNRQIRGKPAGLRTHMLVSLGSALIVMIPLQLGADYSGDAVSRTIQGVATGIGFLGAGEILHQSGRNSDVPKVKGLTSAAAIWATAGMGMAAGCGLWMTSLCGVLLAWLVLAQVKRLEQVAIKRSDLP